MIISSYGHSDVGFVREKNEDSFLVDDQKGLYAVADGVGGLPFGALASKLAVQFFHSSIHNTESFTTEQELRSLAHIIHHNIVESGTIVGGENGIGCTFSGLRLVGDKIVFVHVGDSSIYLNDGNGFRKVSKCHTLGDELIAKHGPEASVDMPDHYMHTLTRCMGQDIDFEVDIGEIPVNPGSSVLVCSDGVTNMVELSEIEKMINELDAKYFVQSVIDLANQNGGTDNSTAVCIKFS